MGWPDGRCASVPAGSFGGPPLRPASGCGDGNRIGTVVRRAVVTAVRIPCPRADAISKRAGGWSPPPHPSRGHLQAPCCQGQAASDTLIDSIGGIGGIGSIGGQLPSEPTFFEMTKILERDTRGRTHQLDCHMLPLRLTQTRPNAAQDGDGGFAGIKRSLGHSAPLRCGYPWPPRELPNIHSLRLESFDDARRFPFEWISLQNGD
jgi:hypothetical protein